MPIFVLVLDSSVVLGMPSRLGVLMKIGGYARSFVLRSGRIKTLWEVDCSELGRDEAFEMSCSASVRNRESKSLAGPG